MDFHSHFSDDSAQNAATTFEHMKRFIHWMHKNNLFIKDGIIYDTSDVCIKQYRCANTMWLLFILEFAHIVILYRCIHAPVHGRRKIDGINGSNTKYFKKCA